MSTILKALRRLEDDRSQQVSRPLREQVVSSPADQATVPSSESERARPARVLLAIALVVGVMAGAGTLAYLSVRGEPVAIAPSVAAMPVSPPRVEPPPDPEFMPELAESAPSFEPEFMPGPVPGASQLPAAALASEVKVVKRPLPGPRLPDTEVQRAAEAELAAKVEIARGKPFNEPPPRPPAPPPRQAETRAQTPPPPAPPAEKVAKASPPVAESSPATPTPKPPKPAPAKAPPVTKASAKPAPIVKAVVPSVRVEQTRWHPDAARRTALVQVDGGEREVQEGDSVGPLEVSKIEPSGVVFLRDGVELRRRIGE